MRSLTEKFDEWAGIEEEEMMIFLKKRYGPFPQLSLLYPSWKPSMRAFTIYLFFLHTLLLSTHLALLNVSCVLSLLERNLGLVSLSIHFSLLVTYGLFMIYFANYQREVYTKQNLVLMNDIGEYRSGRIYDDDFCVVERKKNRTQLLYYLSMPLLIGVASVYIIGGPYTYNWIVGMENPYTSNMVNKNLPFPCWYPFPTHEGVLHWVALFGQLLAALSLALVLVTLLLFLINNTQRIRFEMRVVGHSLRTVFSRSERMYLQKNPHKRRMDLRDDQGYQWEIGLCLKEIVIHHQTLQEMISLYSEQIDMPGAIAYTIGTGVIGMSLFNILMALKEGNYSYVVLFSIMVVCETLVMFVMSLCGESITTESEKLRNDLYFSKWYYLDVRNRRTLLNIHTAMTEPVVISAMGLINLNMDTFSSIINTAYSFFNLMGTQIE